jgi:hypothetical protein
MITATGTLPTEKAKPSLAHARRIWPEFFLGLAATSIVVGILWDISWHMSIGRDSFWTMAHMAIYLGGALGGSAGGWLAIKYTFLVGPEEQAATVRILGARAPLGAWIAIWGGIAMLTSGPFDDWWHNAYGLDVKIISPPHVLLGLGMFGISIGALLLAVARQNREPDGPGAGMFIYVGGLFLALGAVFVTEYSWPNLQHSANFYEVAGAMFAFRLVTMGRAGRISWPATRVALVYTGIYCLMIWILPLFPAQPRLAPIYSQLTRMVPPAFPLLLVFPAVGIDLFLRGLGDDDRGFRRVGRALVLGMIFLALFLAVQWFFAEFLISPRSNNWFFAGGGGNFGYGSGPGSWRNEFWRNRNGSPAPPLDLKGFIWSWIISSGSAWLGLLWGGWMRRVKR